LTSEPGRRADALLDGLGGGLADQHAVVAADVVDDGLVELVAADADRALVDHAAQRDHADLGGAAADVDDHRAGGLGHRQAGADRGGHRFLDQVHLGGAGAQGGVADGAALHLGGAAGHADDDARAGREHRARMHHLDELLDHLLGDHEVGDHAVLHGRMASMLPGTLPSMALASWPTAWMTFLPFGPPSWRMETTEGSSSTMPLPRT
jgi:hypothetical protein